MRRADRLFQIIQILRRTTRPTTAQAIAAELEVSTRSVYRDIADLLAQRVPIRAEAGVGYVLDAAYDMPPLMLTPEEIEAAVLGAQLVAARGDPGLVQAARDLIAKIAVVVPERLRPFVEDPAVGAPVGSGPGPDGLDMAWLRAAIRAGRKIRITYRDAALRESERIVWPVLVGYAETVRLLAAWCETRAAFRHFRTDRIVAASFLDERYATRPAALRYKWRRFMAAERGLPMP